MNDIPLDIHTHLLLAHRSVSGHGLLPLLAAVRSAALSMCVQLSLQDCAFSSFQYIPRDVIAGSYNSILNIFWGTTLLFFI